MARRKVMKQNPRKVWEESLADISRGGRRLAAVEGFDAFTGDMLRADLITLDEFVATQTVIAAALAGARQFDRAVV